MTIGELLKRDQPKEYALLMAMCHVEKNKDPEQALREIESLMGHATYNRGHGGAIRQVGRRL